MSPLTLFVLVGGSLPRLGTLIQWLNEGGGVVPTLKLWGIRFARTGASVDHSTDGAWTRWALCECLSREAGASHMVVQPPRDIGGLVGSGRWLAADGGGQWRVLSEVIRDWSRLGYEQRRGWGDLAAGYACLSLEEPQWELLEQEALRVRRARAEMREVLLSLEDIAGLGVACEEGIREFVEHHGLNSDAEYPAGYLLNLPIKAFEAALIERVAWAKLERGESLA